MSPRNTNDNGGTRGRAAFIGAIRAGAARADEMWSLAPGFGLVGLSIILLVTTAPELWPRLFAAQ